MKESGRSVIGLLVGMAVLVGVTLFFVVGPGLGGDEKPAPRADGRGTTTVGRALMAGKDTQCQNALSQLRGSIQINTDPVEGTKPATLEETRLGSQFYNCPVGGERYTYDPETGRAGCVYPGHENY